MPSYSHLLEDERDQIGVLRAAGRSIGAIARALGRAKATVSRELQRNALPWAGTRRFTPPEPINCAGGVKRSSNEDPAERLFVGDRLAEGWTPEQIAGWFKSGNERGCGPSAARPSTPSSIGPHTRPRACGVI